MHKLFLALALSCCVASLLVTLHWGQVTLRWALPVEQGQDEPCLVLSQAERGEPLEQTNVSVAEKKTQSKVLVAKKERKVSSFQCKDFPTWPLSAGSALFHDRVGEPRCLRSATPHRWVLHVTSSPERRPSRSEVQTILAKLPSGTGYIWHDDDDICAFMRTQPLRFQALFNALSRPPHQLDLWRYLFLYEKGGIYLDDDGQLLAEFNASFINSVDSVYVTQGNSPKAMGNVGGSPDRSFGVTVYNGFLVSKPCNRVLLSVAERMVQIGPDITKESLHPADQSLPVISNWYSLKLLAVAIADRAPQDLQPNPHCLDVHPQQCVLFNRSSTTEDHYRATFQGEPLVLYKDDHDWTTAVFDCAYSFRPVTQVAGGKHDAVAPKNPHPSPWEPYSVEAEKASSFDAFVELLQKTSGSSTSTTTATAQNNETMAMANEIMENATRLFYSPNGVRNDDRTPANRNKSVSNDYNDTYTGGPIIVGLEQCASFRRQWGTKATARIAGTFNTGTNALTNNLQLNLWNPKQWKTFNAVPWWKHNPNFAQIGHRDPVEHANVLPIVVIRDPYLWRKSTCTAAYNLDWDGKAKGLCPVVPQQNNDTVGTEVTMQFGGSSFKFNGGGVRVLPNATSTWPSLYHAWNEFYNQYLEAAFPRLIVRFEDTMFHLPQIIREIQQCIGADWKSKKNLKQSSFVAISNRYGLPAVRVDLGPSKTHGNAKNEEFSFVGLMKKNTDAALRFYQMSQEELEYSRKALDPTLMRIFHYTYPTQDDTS